MTLSPPSDDADATEDEHIILHPDELIVDPSGRRFRVVTAIGEGTYGRVFKVIEVASSAEFALKVTLPGDRIVSGAVLEAQLMVQFQENISEAESRHFLKIHHFFTIEERAYLVFDLLHTDIARALVNNRYRGFPLSVVQAVARQLFEAAAILENSGIIHGDIKPGNILMEGMHTTAVKLGDFGCARLVEHPCPELIQSLYYRAPEVVLGLYHDAPIDIWSIGCVIAELFLGLPLLCGQNEIQLLELQQQFLGAFPIHLIARSPKRDLFFEPNFRLKSQEDVCRELGTEPAERFVCFTETTLEAVVMKYLMGFGRTPEERGRVRQSRGVLLDLIRRTLTFDPEERIKARDALGHPFFSLDFTH